MEEYVILGKKYTLEEVAAVYKFWRNKLNNDIVDDAIHEALCVLQEDSPDIEAFARANIGKVTTECRMMFPAWENYSGIYLADCDKSYSSYARELIKELYQEHRETKPE